MSYRKWNPGCPCCSTNSVFSLGSTLVGGPSASFGLYNSCESFHTYNEWIAASGYVDINNTTPLSGVHYIPYFESIGVGNFYYHHYKKNIVAGQIDLYYHVGTIYSENACTNTLSYGCMLHATNGGWHYYEKKTDCLEAQRVGFDWNCSTGGGISTPPTGIHVNWDILF